MTTLTIELPESLTEQLQTYHISKQQLRVAVTNFIQNYIHRCQTQPQTSTPVYPDVATTLSELDSLADQDLWHIVDTAMDRVDLVTMETLSAKQHETQLTSAEENQAQELLDRYDHAVLIRAKAMALLKKRGHDISLLQQSHFTQ
jgi:uncharacterized Fe-S center protein